MSGVLSLFFTFKLLTLGRNLLMRFALFLVVAISLGGASSAALAQPLPAAARDNVALTDGPGAPAVPHVQRRRAPVPAAPRPPEAPLAIDGPATLGMLTGGVNGTFVHIGGDIAAVASSDTLRVLPLIGRGSLQNLADLFNLRGVDLALVSADSARAAEARGLYPGLRNRVHYIAKLYDQEVHILAPHDVYTVADLADKVVNVDVAGSGSSVTGPAVFEAMHIPIKQAHDAPAVALEKLKRGEIAAMVFTPAKPNRLFASIPPDAGLHLLQLPVSDALVDTYVPAKFTHADYPSLVPEDEDVQTWAVPVLLIAYNWPVGTARYNSLAAFTDLFFSNIPDLLQPPYQKKWRDVNIWATVPGWTRAPYAQRWLDRSGVQNAASAPVAAGFEREAFNEWAAGIGFTKMTPAQSAQLFSLWRLRRSQGQ